MTKKETTLSILDNILHFWLDHLEVYATCKLEKDLFEKLDFDNSNYWELEDYSFTKNEVPKHKYKIIFTKENYSLFAYYKWDKDLPGIIKSKDKLVIYSTAFKLLTYDEILYFLEWYFTVRKCFRFDVCIDINLDTDYILEHFTNLNTGKEYKKGWSIETRYIWVANRYKNKRLIIRVYNKILDIHEKHKHKLYKEYLAEKFVTRLELEVRSELAKNITYKEVFDNTILSSIFKNYFRKHTNIFNIKDVEDITLFRKPLLTVDMDGYQSLLYKTKRRNVFIWHGRGIYHLWFCPVRTLIAEWLILPQTEKLLWWDLVKLIQEHEIELKNKARMNDYERKDKKRIISKFIPND